MRELETQASRFHGMSPSMLMANAGLATFEYARTMIAAGSRITVLCGGGNNGGDGVVAARIAHERGMDCILAMATKPDRVNDECSARLREAEKAGAVPIWPGDPTWDRALNSLEKRNLVIDAVIGTGLESEVRDDALVAVQMMESSGAPTLSIDIPTGLTSDTGEEMGMAVHASATIVLGLPKPYLFKSGGMRHAGRWHVDPIGFPNRLLARPSKARMLTHTYASHRIPHRMSDAHKGDSGHLLVVAGSDSMPGAAVLTARAALAAGAGLVQVAGRERVCNAVAAQLPEAVLLPLTGTGVNQILNAQERTDAAVFGPGLTTEPNVKRMLHAVWAKWRKPSCIDADALRLIADGIDPPKAKHCRTPHPGELSDLMDWSVEKIQRRRFGAARAATKLFKCPVALKGAYTVISDGERPLLVNDTGNLGMATGGMGDALSGVVGALLAQGVETRDALACAVYWHGLAADMAAEIHGDIGYTVSHLIEQIPHARVRLNPV